jgi:hypothetical protein
MTGKLVNAVKPFAGEFTEGPLTGPAPPPTPKINPALEKIFSEILPALGTVNVPVNTDWKA